MVDAFQRDPQRGSHPAGGDDSHLEPGWAQSVELHHRRRPSQVSWFVPVPRCGYRTVVKTLPRRWRRGAVVFASVLAASAPAALGRSWFAAAPAVRRPTGHPMAARRCRERIGAAMPSRWAAVAATSPALVGSGGDGGGGGVGGGGGDIAGAGVADPSMPGSEYSVAWRDRARRPGSAQSATGSPVWLGAASAAPLECRPRRSSGGVGSSALCERCEGLSRDGALS